MLRSAILQHTIQLSTVYTLLLYDVMKYKIIYII